MHQYIEFLTSNPVLSLAWIGIVIALISMMVKEKNAKYKTIGINEATALVNNEEGVFLDIRNRDEFRKGHIVGSVHILPSQIQRQNTPELEKHKAAPIIVVCKTGQTAQETANQLSKDGFTNVSVLKDGLIAWNEANLPLVASKKK
ncbi:rhodanese-like domain-containing protein [Photobacterium toruni]|uniref:Rhodanese-like domain-containing protein n=1 Tax=Photobacterium toruni TaxID=1935446 RepID=A0A1T4S6Q1_9GAMM|nr:rhodanese-like domain-containing protein [Photobacterium toruni]MEC6815520.1 rhodanese-like domain-containing protein [Photobacterium toruni]MEC6832574.1 rhodanese-like domain-containing protein [Photobacterium toruni]SKA23756.1 Thiosulfate sulfurtransferase GlpE [Photobacterium toruni]